MKTLKTYNKFSYIKNLTLFSLIVLSSKVQADIVTILNGGDTTKTLSSITTAVAAVQTVVDNLNSDHDSITGTGIDGTTTAVTGGTSLTASTNNLSSISKSLSAIEGAGFATGTDSLKVISDEINLIQDNGNSSGTVITGGTSYVATTNDLTSLSRAISAIEGTGFATATDSLKAHSTNLANLGTSSDVSSLYTTLAYIIANIQVDPVAQVNSAKGLAALTTNITLGGTPVAGTTTAKNTYETNLATARTAATTATTIATQSNANTTIAITNLNTAITNFDSLMTQIISTADNSYISSKYGEASIKWALDQLLWSLQQLKSKQATA